MSMARWRIAVMVSLALAGAAMMTPSRFDTTRNYTPSAAVAEDAVRRALEAWQAGAQPGALPGTKPVIYVTDTGRRPGQLLESYAILCETRGTGGRSYAVTLNLKNPADVVKTKYLVVGIDPIWVFRQEDYELLMHWDHHMTRREETADENPEPQK